MRHWIRLVAIAFAIALGFTATGGTTPAQAAPVEYKEGDAATAIANFAFSPDRLPGVNDWNCKPSADHPRPVILQHATFVNLGANFVKIAPRLKNEGYCVFAKNYGMNFFSANRVGGLTSADKSVAAFGAFVDKVLDATGADQIDVVGHSQGGEIPFAYIKLAGGAAKVAHYVSWGGTQHGTTVSGLGTLATSLGAFGFVETFSAFLQTPGVTDQVAGSAFQKKLWATPNVPAGPDYTTIATTHDRVTTPYQNQALEGADNVVLQDLCPSNPVGHVGMFLDEPTLQVTMNALADGPDDFQPECRNFGPAF